MPALVDPDCSDSESEREDDEGDDDAAAEPRRTRVPVPAFPMDGNARMRRVFRARRLVAEGELSRAVSELESKGLGDLPDPFVVRQLEEKHPLRRTENELPSDLSAFADEDRPLQRLVVRLKEPMRKLRRMRGTGITGYRNEYLKALSEEFEDPRLRPVVPLIEDFAARRVDASGFAVSSATLPGDGAASTT